MLTEVKCFVLTSENLSHNKKHEANVLIFKEVNHSNSEIKFPQILKRNLFWYKAVVQTLEKL